MASSIVLKGKAVTEVGTDISFSVALALNDGSKDIAATFGVETDETTLPMIGVTEYGKLVGLVSDDSTHVTVYAIPLGGDETDKVEAETTVADILAAEIDASIASA